ncbi:glycosyltransferase family 9 protein [Geomonas sp. RF6]|uniref:glycosyltransferase family 9 protein n=1 Tax=Geomonas sp. RF6 TaxID=2897342 RepID=UPI001E649E11|nr:glycosyltransferase family 9 protein [Geomonas sp. RF6]UFS69738.1 glycosyltransferase family 9 protein [Geomonas sp. RF6]
MKIKLIKLVDRVAGKGATMCLPPPAQRPVPSPRSILVIRPGGIGDAVLLLPALRALQRAFPACRIDVLAERRNAGAFRFISGLGSVRCYDSARGLGEVLRCRYDVVIDTEQWYHLSAVVARLTRAPVLIGFGTNERRRLFTHSVPYPREFYEADAFFRLLEPLGITAPPLIETPFVELSDSDRQEGARLLAQLGDRRYITLFPGASAPEKLWNGERFREVVSLLNRRGVAVVLLGGKDTVAAAEAVARGTGALNLAGATSLAVSAAVIEGGEGLISGDSGLLHIAAGLGKPTAALFGPSDPRKWAPRGESHIVVAKDLQCAPCSSFGTIPRCTAKEKCMEQISVGDFLERMAGHPLWGAALGTRRDSGEE